MDKVKVMICGEVITLKANEDEAYLQRIARYIDQKMDNLLSMNVAASINERIRTLLIAINVADDYFKANDKLARLNAEHEKYVNEIGRMQQENMLLKEKLYELQGELIQTKSEHEALKAELESAKSGEGVNVLPLPRAEQRKAAVR